MIKARLDALVDEPVPESAALDLSATMIEDVLGTRVGRPTVALLDAVTVDTIRGTTTRMLWCLFLVVV
jgi:hypothetical protein